MTQPQISTDWLPETYAVDEFNKVVWKQGGHAVAMGLAGKTDTLIPGYVISLCTREELVGIRHRIKADETRRDEEPFTKEEEEELGRMFEDGFMRRRKRPEPEPQPKRTWFTNKDLKPYLLPISIVLLGMTQIPSMIQNMHANHCVEYERAEEARQWRQLQVRNGTIEETDLDRQTAAYDRGPGRAYAYMTCKFGFPNLTPTRNELEAATTIRHVCPYCGQKHSSGWHLSAHTSYFHDIPRATTASERAAGYIPRSYWRVQA